MKDRAILVAEDSEDDFFLLERAISRAGLTHPVRRVKDGDEAILYISGMMAFSDRAEYPVPLLMLLDLKMPVKHGFDVLRWRREHPQGRILPVIVFSSSNRLEDVQLAYELGANAFLSKATTVESLTEAVHAIDAFWLRKNCFAPLWST